MDSQRLRTNLDRLGETDSLLPVAMWVEEGVCGRVMCLNCGIKTSGRDQLGHCRGCPQAWRENGLGEIEFKEPPEFS